MIILGCYTYPDHPQVSAQFKEMVEASGTVAEVKVITKLPEGEYGISHVQAYLEELEKADPEDNILLTDIRDVIIQGPVQEVVFTNMLRFFQEDSSRTIGSSEYNAYWLERFYGKDILRRLRNRAIINAGVMLGQVTLMTKYLRILLKEMKRVEQPAHNNGIDMASHNYLYHIGNHDMKILCTATENVWPVYTIGYTDKITVSRHRILNKNGDIPYIVHQYDRHLEVL